MDIRKNHPLAPLTTFKVQASAETYVRFAAEDEILDFLACQPLANRRWMVLGGGSNLLFVEDFDGVLLHPALQGTAVLQARRGHVLVKAMAGEKWDDLVALAVVNGWGGVENLSHIPGSVGASAVQNIGAYGVEVKDVIERIEAISIPDAAIGPLRSSSSAARGTSSGARTPCKSAPGSCRVVRGLFFASRPLSTRTPHGFTGPEWHLPVHVLMAERPPVERGRWMA